MLVSRHKQKQLYGEHRSCLALQTQNLCLTHANPIRLRRHLLGLLHQWAYDKLLAGSWIHSRTECQGKIFYYFLFSHQDTSGCLWSLFQLFYQERQLFLNYSHANYDFQTRNRPCCSRTSIIVSNVLFHD